MSFLQKIQAQYRVVAITVSTIKVTPNKKLDAAKVNEWYEEGGTLGGDKADFEFDSCTQKGNTLIFTNVSSSEFTNKDDLENEFKETLFWAIDSAQEEFANRNPNPWSRK